jgi:4-hydroxy-tetrahydrodipicolinate reductase
MAQGVARIGIIGSEGRMGHALREAIAAAGHEYAGGVDKDGGDIVQLAKDSDVLVDFSNPASLEDTLDAAMAALTPIVVGTTGLEERHHWLLDSAAQRIAVLQTGNTSLGVNLLAHLVQEAASRLGEDWDIEIAETHHRRKVDAPSGTALLLGEAAAKGRGIVLGDIGFASLRGGSVAGDHTVYFLADDERLALSHVAENRGIFAKGAVRAAGWLLGQEAGRFAMKEVLGL